MSVKEAPNTFEQDFSQFILSRLIAAHRDLNLKDVRYKELSDEQDKIREKIMVSTDRELLEAFEENNNAMESISLDKAYIQGLLDGLNFKETLLGRAG